MGHSPLRVYCEPPDELESEGIKSTGQADRVEVPLHEILPLLSAAFQSRRTWLADFDREQVSISTDLYEVILAYQHYRRPSA